MKIAFVHSEKEFTTQLLGELKGRLKKHEIISWIENEVAPANDFDAVVAMGIGRLLADRLKPFGVNIAGTDDHPKHIDGDIAVFHTDQLKEAVAAADYVVLCVRAASDNENLINAETLSAMKKGAILINIARGTLVAEAALFDAVKIGHIAAVGLDVMQKEPVDKGNPLLSLPQVLITPHITGNTDITLKGMGDYAVKVIIDFAAGKNPEALVNNP